MKKKLSLKDIEVKSFITKLDSKEVKGGIKDISDLGHSICRTCEFHCDPNW